ncbi:MAG: DUF1194 domain-containing protein [Pseudomonadota bacterium]
MGQHGKHRALVTSALCLLGAVVEAQSTACRQALALGLDVSASVDSDEYRLQLEGLARALTSDAVSRRILDGAEAPISLYVFEWSGPDVQRTILDWVAITDIGVLSASALAIQRHERDPVGDTVDHSTSVATAISHGITAIAQQNHCWKRTIDISGDGKHNTGGDPRMTWPNLAAAAITVNGLVVGVDSPRGGDIRQLEIGELSSYYHAQVIFGPGAFVETALGFSDFERAMKRKLLRELQGPVFGALPAQ